MSSLNPISKLYDDVVTILKNMVIKYSAKADEYETLDIRLEAETYIGGNPAIPGQGGIHSEPQRAVCYTA